MKSFMFAGAIVGALLLATPPTQADASATLLALLTPNTATKASRMTPRPDFQGTRVANRICREQCDTAFDQCIAAGTPEDACKSERRQCKSDCNL